MGGRKNERTVGRLTVRFTADLHLGHKNIIKYCSRPFDNVAKMNKAIIRNLNVGVSDNDLMYILGDNALTKNPDILNLLHDIRGRKILILGNHDNQIPQEDWIDKYGFESVHDYYIAYHNEQIFIMAHDPVDTLFLARRIGSNMNPVLLNGHVHNLCQYSVDNQTGNFSINVGLDVNSLKPMDIGDVMERQWRFEEELC